MSMISLEDLKALPENERAAAILERRDEKKRTILSDAIIDKSNFDLFKEVLELVPETQRLSVVSDPLSILFYPPLGGYGLLDILKCLPEGDRFAALMTQDYYGFTALQSHSLYIKKILPEFLQIIPENYRFATIAPRAGGRKYKPNLLEELVVGRFNLKSDRIIAILKLLPENQRYLAVTEVLDYPGLFRFYQDDSRTILGQAKLNDRALYEAIVNLLPKEAAIEEAVGHIAPAAAPQVAIEPAAVMPEIIVEPNPAKLEVILPVTVPAATPASVVSDVSLPKASSEPRRTDKIVSPALPPVALSSVLEPDPAANLFPKKRHKNWFITTLSKLWQWVVSIFKRASNFLFGGTKAEDSRNQPADNNVAPAAVAVSPSEATVPVELRNSSTAPVLAVSAPVLAAFSASRTTLQEVNTSIDFRIAVQDDHVYYNFSISLKGSIDAEKVASIKKSIETKIDKQFPLFDDHSTRDFDVKIRHGLVKGVKGYLDAALEKLKPIVHEVAIEQQVEILEVIDKSTSIKNGPGQYKPQ